MKIRTALFILLGAVLFLVGGTIRAHADWPTVKRTHPDYGSGYWGGPASGPVVYGNPATADVLMAGDSITKGCSSALVAEFGRQGLTLAIVAQAGQQTHGVHQLVRQHLVTPRRIVFATGTNNVYNPPAMTHQAAAVRAWAASKDLRWVSTYVARPATKAADLRNSAWVNRGIGLPAAKVIGWRAALEAKPSRVGLYVKPDGVHLTEPGCAFLAALIAGGIR